MRCKMICLHFTAETTPTWLHIYKTIKNEQIPARQFSWEMQSVESTLLGYWPVIILNIE